LGYPWWRLYSSAQSGQTVCCCGIINEKGIKNLLITTKEKYFINDIVIKQIIEISTDLKI
jgi:hypothetical protein